MIPTAPKSITANLDGRPTVARHAGRNGTKADVCVYEIDGRRIAVKDYAPRGFLARNLLGRALVRRECRAYAAAGEIPGLVPFLGRVSPYALATAWIDARPLSARLGERLPAETFDRLDAILTALHAKGVALADLHHRDVLLAESGDVHVLDLAAAVVGGPLFARAAAQDRLAAARIRARFTGMTEDEAFAALDPSSVRLWRLGRRAKGLLNRLRGK